VALKSDSVVAGRVYLGEFEVTTGGTVLDNELSHAYNGVYDTGWANLSTFGWGTTYPHYLGVIPASMEIWVKNAAASASGTVERDPTLLVQVENMDSQSGGSPVLVDARIPALKNQCSDTTFRVDTLDPNGTSMAYTDYGDTDVADNSAVHSIRVILRR
jgi:hypothetical protein